MPAYYSNEEIIHMFVNSNEVINSHDTKLGHIKQKLYIIYTNLPQSFPTMKSESGLKKTITVKIKRDLSILKNLFE